MDIIIFLFLLFIAGIAYLVSPSFREECDKKNNEMYGGVVILPEELSSTLSLEKNNHKYTVRFYRQSGNEYKPEQVYYNYNTMIKEINTTLKRAKVDLIRIPQNLKDVASIHRSPYNYNRGAAEGKRFGSVFITSELITNELNVDKEIVKFWYISTYALVYDLNIEDGKDYNSTLKHYVNCIYGLEEEEKIIREKELDNIIRKLYTYSRNPEECAKLAVKNCIGIDIPKCMLEEFNAIIAEHRIKEQKKNPCSYGDRNAV